ncbi:MAG TPA: GNAT family N-acetyltransferase [Acidimicrobiia bacterium]
MNTDEATTRLLVEHLDAERFGHPGYLRWFYRDNPRGEALDENEDDEHGNRIGHYAVIPTIYRTPAGTTPFIFSSNVATSPTVRRGGLFRAMAERMYERARATGAPGMVGVGNDNSTIVVVERFGWKSLGPLPVRVCVPIPWRGRAVESRPVDAALLASPWFAEIAADLDWVPVARWAQSWTPEFLRWRLSRPDGGYVIHVTPEAVAVSVIAHARFRVRCAVLLKVFPRPGATLPLSPAPMIAAACGHHRAPLCVYAGFNAHVPVRGVPSPRRLQPSPLNLVFKSLDETRAPTATFQLDTFEFLDMDAY